MNTTPISTDGISTKDTTLGLDIGGGALKLFGPAGGIELPAHIASAGHRTHRTHATGLRVRKPPIRVLLDGTGFYVGLGAHDWGRPIENLNDTRFEGSPEVQALLYAGLTRYCDRVEPITTTDLMVGLTQSAFSNNVAPYVKPWLAGQHTWAIEHASRKRSRPTPHALPYTVEVGHVDITTQAAGALFDYFLDDAGKPIPKRKAAFKQEVGIISVGMNTLEMLVLRNGATVERFTHSVTAGVRRMLEIHDPSGLYSRGELDTQLRQGQLDHKAAVPIWASEIQGHIEHAWGNAFRRFATIIVVGGGVLLLHSQLTAHLNGKAFVPDKPILAVARGLYKLGLQRKQRRRRGR